MTSMEEYGDTARGVDALEELHQYLKIVPLELHFLLFHRIYLHSNVELVNEVF